MTDFKLFVDFMGTFPIILGRQKWKITKGTATNSVCVNEAAFRDWIFFPLSAVEKAQTRKLPKEQVFHEITACTPEKREYTLTVTDKSTRYATHTTKRPRKFLWRRSKHFAVPDNTCTSYRIMRGGESKTYTKAATGLHALFILIFVCWSALICHVLIAGINILWMNLFFKTFQSFQELWSAFFKLW